WRLVALFSPEHGIRGDAPAGQSVASSVDDLTGLPIYSLYGETTRPTGRMLDGLDILVFDIQDVGARTFTYPSTLLEVMRAAAQLYPGTVLFEGTSLSEGRGTERPFEWMGAPWIDGSAWADALNARALSGVRFTPSDHTPDSSKFAGELCHGVSIEIVDRLRL